jgi:small subunit ribosomal protein S4
MLQIKSKFKIGKRLGGGIFEQLQTQRFALSEARTKKAKFKKQLSDYGKQMLEKQKVRFSYGISEHQFTRYVNGAMESGQPVSALYERLETRLDNVVYRMGLAKTRRAARQAVSHGHFTVNGRKSNVPSREMFPGDVVAVRDGSKGYGLYAGLAEKELSAPPAWLAFDVTKLSGKIVEKPRFVAGETGGLDFAAVLEFYSR